MKFTKKAENVGEKSNIVSYQRESVKIMRVYLQFFDGGGEEIIPLPTAKESYRTLYNISTWYYTDLGDERAEYNLDYIKLTHKPLKTNFKIGVGHPAGNVKYINKGVTFEKSYKIFNNKTYTDGGVSYETYLCEHMVEVETLSPLFTIKPNKTAVHTEKWILSKNKK